jgi:hypothetical protein
MMKFFRKYTKTLLAVFMALLLVVWLGGDALRYLFDKERDFGSEVVAKAFGRDVKQAELTRTKDLEDIGERLVRFWKTPWVQPVLQMAGGNEQMAQGLLMSGRQEPLTLDEWYLLDAEAARKGVHVSTEAVNQFKANIPAKHLEGIRDAQKLSLAQMDLAIQAYLRIEEAALQASESVAVSEADIQDFVRQTSEKVKIRLVTIDPAKLVDTNYQPPAEQIQAQFDKYKDKAAGGPGEYGYQLDEATQVEYIQVKADELAKSQTVTDDEAYAYWQDHKAEFKQPATQPAATAPATRPEAPKPYDTFFGARADVKKKLAHNKGAKAASRLAEELKNQLAKPWADAPTSQPGGYRQPPASEMAADVYEKLIANFKAKYATALAYGKTPLGDAEQLMVSPLGRSMALADSPNRVPFSQAAFMVNGAKARKEEAPEQARLFRNLFETCAEPVTDSQGNVFVFRNIALRPAQAPASVDEVRDKVITDLRHIQAYEQAEKLAKSLAENARKSGLKAAFDADPFSAKAKEAFTEPAAFARKQMFNMGGMPRLWEGSVPGAGRDKELLDLAFGMASRAATQPAAEIAVHEQKQRQRWMVVEFDKLVPVTRDEYNTMRDQARQFLLATRRLEFVLDWFTHEQIVARTGWEEVHPARSKDKDKDEDKSKEKPAKGGA